jgi:hypothetical protein
MDEPARHDVPSAQGQVSLPPSHENVYQALLQGFFRKSPDNVFITPDA